MALLPSMEASPQRSASFCSVSYWVGHCAFKSLSTLGMPSATLPLPGVMPRGHTWTICSQAVIWPRQGLALGRDPAQCLLLSPVTCLCDQLEAWSRSSTVSNFRKVQMGSLTQPSRPWPHGWTHLTEEALHLSGFKVLAQPLINQHLGSHLATACV